MHWSKTFSCFLPSTRKSSHCLNSFPLPVSWTRISLCSIYVKDMTYWAWHNAYICLQRRKNVDITQLNVGLCGWSRSHDLAGRPCFKNAASSAQAGSLIEWPASRPRNLVAALWTTSKKSACEAPPVLISQLALGAGMAAAGVFTLIESRILSGSFVLDETRPPRDSSRERVVRNYDDHPLQEPGSIGNGCQWGLTEGVGVNRTLTRRVPFNQTVQREEVSTRPIKARSSSLSLSLIMTSLGSYRVNLVIHQVSPCPGAAARKKRRPRTSSSTV